MPEARMLPSSLPVDMLYLLLLLPDLRRLPFSTLLARSLLLSLI